MTARCIVCGRILTDPVSIERRVGPKCLLKLREATLRENPDGALYTEVDVALRKRSLQTIKQILAARLAERNGIPAQICGNCGDPLTIPSLLHCDRTGCFWIPGCGKTQILYWVCVKCGKITTSEPVGITQADIDLALDLSRGYTGASE